MSQQQPAARPRRKHKAWPWIVGVIVISLGIPALNGRLFDTTETADSSSPSVPDQYSNPAAADNERACRAIADDSDIMKLRITLAGGPPVLTGPAAEAARRGAAAFIFVTVADDLVEGAEPEIVQVIGTAANVLGAEYRASSSAGNYTNDPSDQALEMVWSTCERAGVKMPIV